MEFIETTEEEQKEYQDLLERLFERVNYIVKREASNDDEEINDAVERGLAYVFKDKNEQAIHGRVGRILVEHRTMVKMLISIKTGDLNVNDCFETEEEAAQHTHDDDCPVCNREDSDVDEMVETVFEELKQKDKEIDDIGDKEGLSQAMIKKAQNLVDRKSSYLMDEHTNQMGNYILKCLFSLDSATALGQKAMIGSLYARLRAAIYVIAELTKKSHLH